MLVGPGRRLLDLSAVELLNFVYAKIMDGRDQEARDKVNAALEGRLGESGGIKVDDPDLPASLQGMEAPSWWANDHDPFAEQHTIG